MAFEASPLPTPSARGKVVIMACFMHETNTLSFRPTTRDRCPFQAPWSLITNRLHISARSVIGQLDCASAHINHQPSMDCLPQVSSMKKRSNTGLSLYRSILTLPSPPPNACHY